ncbi:MAG TPA: response regulator [Pirellulales bacterium]
MKVLVVDDVPEICQLHERLVRVFGHDTRGLDDPYLAIDEVKHFQPDVVLVDISMPGLDGWELARRIRADPEIGAVRLVAITALASPDDVRRSREAGFNAHYRKPVSIEQWQDMLDVPA